MDFLDGIENDEAVEVELEQETAPEPETPVETTEPAFEPETVEPTAKAEHMVPLSAMMARIEAEKAKVRREYEAQQYQQPEPVEQYEPSEQEVFAESVRIQAIQETSKLLAVEKHGEGAIQAAVDAWNDALKRGEVNGKQMLTQSHPYDFVKNWHDRQQMVASLSADDFAEFQRFKAAKAGAVDPPSLPAASAPKVIIRSTSSLPSASAPARKSNAAQSPDEVFTELFG